MYSADLIGLSNWTRDEPVGLDYMRSNSHTLLRFAGFALAIACCLLFVLRRPDSKSVGGLSRVDQSRGTAPGLRPLVLPRAPRSAGLSGVVTGTDGQTRKARVCATCTSCDVLGTQDQLCTDANSRGEYALSSLGPSGYTITASAPGFAVAAANDGQPVYIEPDTHRAGVDIVLSTDGYGVAGRVLDALGGPIAGATVRIVSWGDVPLSTSVASDDEGHFLARVGSVRVTAIASASGYASARAYHVAPTEDLTLVLTPASSIAGKVVTVAEGRPVVGAQVFARSTDPSVAGSGEGVSREDGAFEIGGLEPGQYSLYAVARGFQGRASGVQEVSLAQSLAGVDVLVSPARQVSGRVVIQDAGSARPCEQGYVTLGPPDPALSLREPTKWTLQAIAEQPAPPASVMASIGAGGKVRFDAVPAGSYFASVYCQDHHQDSGPDIVKVETDDIDDLVWQVVQAARLAVLVLDEFGHPVRGVDVNVTWPDGTLTTLTAGPDGWTPAVTHLFPGVYLIEPGGGYRADAVAVEIEPAIPDVRGTLRVKGDSELVVEVRDHLDQPIDDVQVVARTCRVIQIGDPAAAAADGGHAADQQAIDTAPERWVGIPQGLGRFRVGPIQAGCYRVDVSDSIHPISEAADHAQRYEIDVGRRQRVTHHVILDRAAQIDGRLLSQDGSPVQDGWVSAVASGQMFDHMAVAAKRISMYAAHRVATDHDGQFRIPKLESGRRYDLSAEGSDGVRVEHKSVVPGEQVTIRLPEPGTLEGTVTTEQGYLVEDFILEVVFAETQRSLRYEFSKAAGRFALSGVSPGKLQLRIIDRFGAGVELEAQLSAGQHLGGLRMSLPSPSDPERSTVRDSDGS